MVIFLFSYLVTTKSIVIYKENFSPTLFLATVHDKTPYIDLRDRDKAPLNLARRRQRQEEEIKVLVKNNLDKFVRAKDSLDEIYSTKDALFTSNSVEKLSHKYQDLQQAGEALFKSLWDRKKHGEEIKNVLGLIKKYDLIFEMPDNIKENVANRDYKKVVHDYEKAKYFKKKCKSTIFQKTFTAIDNEIQKLRDNLFKQLTIDENNDEIDLKSLVEDQEKYIYYLYQLDSTIDPAETYFKNLINYIAYLLRSSIYEFVPKEILSMGMTPFDAETPKIEIKNREVQALKTILKLTKIMLKNFPLVQKLSKNILGEKYLKKNVTNKQKQQDIMNKKQETIVQLINENIFSTYERKVNQVLSNIDSGNALQETYFDCIKELMKCEQGILELNMPQPFTRKLSEFTSKLKLNYIDSTWKRTINEVSSSYNFEDWVINDEFGVTNLPLKFKEKVLQTISMLSHFVTAKDPIIPSITQNFLNSISSFADCLHQLAYPEDKLASDDQLLMILNNLIYTKENVLHKITYTFVDKFIYEAETRYEKEVEQAVMDFLNPRSKRESFQTFCLFDDLEQLILQSFVQRKTAGLITYFDRGIHLGGYDWKKSNDPNSIRSFVLEFLVDLALVHSSVERKAKYYTQAIFEMLNENVTQIFEQYIRFEIDNMSVNAAFQLDIEFEFIQRALKKYNSKKSKNREILKKLRQYIIESSGFDPGELMERQKQDIIEDFSIKTRVQLDCFVTEKEQKLSENLRGWNTMKQKLLKE